MVLPAAESFPTSVRATSHGISAACGKIGSISVVVWFNYASNHDKCAPAVRMRATCAELTSY